MSQVAPRFALLGGVNGGHSRVNRGFEKRRFEPVNARALCARAGIVPPVQHERSEVVGPVDLNLRTIDYEDCGEIVRARLSGRLVRPFSIQSLAESVDRAYTESLFRLGRYLAK